MDASATSGGPLPKGEQPSALAHLLLSLWSHGHLSASLIQQLAHMATLDGASHPELVPMASCGNWGELAGNAHRDVMAAFCADVQITPPVSIQVEVMDPKTSLHSMEDASLFLPHMLFSDLAHHHPEQFHTMFGLDKLNDFWLEVEKSKGDRLLGHPICLDKRQGLVKRSVQQKESTIPLFPHADGFQSRDSLLCWNWLLNQLHRCCQKGVVLDKRILHFTLLAKELVFDKKMTLDKRVLSLTKGSYTSHSWQKSWSVTKR